MWDPLHFFYKVNIFVILVFKNMSRVITFYVIYILIDKIEKSRIKNKIHSLKYFTKMFIIPANS